MTPIDIIRKAVPASLRRKAGLQIMEQASKSRFTLYPYLWLLYGVVFRNMRLVGDEIVYNHNSYDIRSPRNSAGILMEIFKDEVYEQVHKPERGDIVLDIGAYTGMFTVKASLRVGRTGLVVAIEPEPLTYAYLRWNCRQLSNVRFVPKALSNKQGQGKLYLSPVPGAHSMTYLHKPEDSILVDIITVDELVSELKLPGVDFIKLDAEGAELEVLQGAEKTLAKNKLKLSIASYHALPNGRPEVPLLISFLERRGYEITKARGLREYVYAKKEEK